MEDRDSQARRSLRSYRNVPIRPSKLAHVVIRSAKYEQTRDWYLQVLNAEIAFENEFVCFLRYDDEHHRIGIINSPPSAPLDDAAAGVEHVAFTFKDLGELLANYLRLKELGIDPFWPIIHGPTVSLYYRDPNRIKVELQYDVFELGGKGGRFFRGRKLCREFYGRHLRPRRYGQAVRSRRAFAFANEEAAFAAGPRSLGYAQALVAPTRAEID